jgi:hypothetical protein
MSSSGSEVDAERAETIVPPAISSLWRRGPLARAALLLPIVALVIVIAALVDKPALYPVHVDGSTWRADVRIALKHRVPTGPLNPSGPLGDIPGVGRIVSVVTNYAASGAKESVLFLTAVGINQAGLAYLHNVPPPTDSCSVHLSGPWWQLGPLSTTTVKCGSGFHYTAGG